MPAPQKVSDAEILAVFEYSGDLVLSTTEMANELPISRRGLLKRLDSLAEEGKIIKKDIGGKSIVWYPPQD